MAETPTSFYFADVCLRPQEQIGLHEQDTWEVSWIVLGSGTCQTGGTVEPIAPGEVLLVPPGIPHCWTFDGRVTDAGGCIANVSLSFSAALLDGLVATFPELAATIARLRSIRQAVRFEGTAAAELRALLRRMTAEDAARRTASFLQVLLAIAGGEARQVSHYRSMSRDKRRMEQLRTYVVCNATRDITIADAAAHVGMSRTAFCTFFRRMTGKTFVTFLNEHRVGLACRHLRRSKRSIAEVCYQSGFNSVPYFNRVFRHVCGLSPSEYRQQFSPKP